MDGGRRRRALSTTGTPAGGPGVEDLLREVAPQVVGVLARRSGDFASAEDAVQEALLAAHTVWTRDGIPAQPRAWLVTAATRRLLDAQRSEKARSARERGMGRGPSRGAPDVVQFDDSLTVLLMCCHPVLTPASAVALTLRAVGRPRPRRRSPPHTSSRRPPWPTHLARQATGAPERPGLLAAGPDELDERVARVLAVLYLLYNEG